MNHANGANAANVEPVVREADGLHVAFRCMSDVSPGEQLLFDCLESCSGQCYIHDSGGLPDHGVDRGLVDQGASTNGPLPAKRTRTEDRAPPDKRTKTNPMGVLPGTNQRMRTTRWEDDQTADETDVEPVVERASQSDMEPFTHAWAKTLTSSTSLTKR